MNLAERNSAPRLPKAIPSLDGLRAVAILLVIVGHSVRTWGAPKFLAPLEHAGNLGVRIFFVISGLLITTLLLREAATCGQVSLKDFYARRALRILPAFLLFVAAIELLTALHIVDSPPSDFIRATTFTMDYRDDKSWPLNHLWSLSVEEQFYLLWGALFVLTTRAKLRATVIFLAILPIGFRCFYIFGELPTHNPVAPARQFECVLDALALGALLAIFFNTLMDSTRLASFARSPRCLWSGIALTVGAVGSYLLSSRMYDSIGQSVANVGLGLIVWYSVTAPSGFAVKILNWRPIAFIGVLSYSLYLWQQLFLNPNSRSFYAHFPVNVALAFCAAAVSYFVIERPFFRLRARFRSPVVAGAGVSADRPLHGSDPQAGSSR